jgi:2-hydroxychromene-2-carboxylate isomerase
MHTNIDFYFDYGSPTSYLAYRRLPAIAERTGAQINYRPILLGGILKATGNAAPTAVPAKGEWFFADLSRWANATGRRFKGILIFLSSP